MNQFLESNIFTDDYYVQKRERPTGQDTILQTEKIPTWLYEVNARMKELSKLPFNWDGSGAQPIHSQIYSSTMEIITALMSKNIPAPQIVPTFYGGLQIEWHEHGIDLEIEVTSAVSVKVYWEDDNDQPDGQEQPLSTYDLSPLIHYAELLEHRISLSE